MKAYKVTLVFVDFDQVGFDSIKNLIEGARYPNRCISPQVMDIKEADIGEWSDDHPLNKIDPEYKKWRDIFK